MKQYTVLIIHNDEIMQKLMEHATGTENYQFRQAGKVWGACHFSMQGIRIWCCLTWSCLIWMEWKC